MPGGETPGDDTPSNVFSLPPAKSRSNGTVLLIVRVPGEGRITARDATASTAQTSAIRKPLFKKAARSATAAGNVRLVLRPTSAGRKRLAKRGRMKARALVTFAPTGGTPKSQTKKIVFRKTRR